MQCLDCLHDQPHLALTFYDEDGRRISRIEPVEDRWERMVTGTPWVASCTVTVDADQVESCSGPDAAESLAFAAFGDHGTREFFTHVRFHKHEEDRIVIHMLVELYAALVRRGHRRDGGRRPRRADDHLTGRGVPPAGVEPRRGALARSARAPTTPRAASASISSIGAPELPQHLGGVLARGAAAGSPRSWWRPRSARPRARAGRRSDARPSGRRAAGRGRRGERVRHRAHLAGGHAGGVEIASASPPRDARAKRSLRAAARAPPRCSTRPAFVTKRSSRPSSAMPSTEQSARNRPSFAAATAIRPDEVSKSW